MVTGAGRPVAAAALQAFLAACRQSPLSAQPLVVRPADSPETWCRLELVSNRRRSDERGKTLR